MSYEGIQDPKVEMYLKRLDKKLCEHILCSSDGAGVIEVTLAEAQTLVNNSTVVVGGLYKITGVHKNKPAARIEVLYDDGTNSGVTIYLWGIAPNEFSAEGWGEFYNPNYDHADYGGVDPDGAGFYLYNIWNGDGYDGGDAPTYAQGRHLIWGGYVWENVAGNLGVSTTPFSLDSEWTKVAYNNTDYTKVVDYIEYDFANDWITRRRQAEPVIDVIFPFQFWNDADRAPAQITFHGIAAMQWGNKYSKTTHLGVGLMNINDSYCELINFRGKYALGISMFNYSWIHDNDITKDSYLDGLTLNNYSYMAGGYLDTASYLKSIVLDNYSWFASVNLVDSYIESVRLTNSSYFEDLAVFGSSYVKRVVADNGGWIGNQEALLLNAGSYIEDVVLSNLSYITGELDSSYISRSLFTNEGYIASPMTSAGVTLCTFNRIAFGNLLEDQILSECIFNGGGLGFQDMNISSPGVTYRILTHHFETTVILNINFTGAAGRGAVGALTIPGIPISTNAYIEQVVVNTDGLTAGGGSNITLGIGTDAIDSGLDAVDGLVTSLNAAPAVIYNALGFEQATTDRPLVMAVGGANVTAGNMRVTIKIRGGL